MGSDQLADLIRAKKEANKTLERYKEGQRYLRPEEALMVYQALENVWDTLVEVTTLELQFQDDPTAGDEEETEDEECWSDECWDEAEEDEEEDADE
jgi:hypothetical protein